jgi:hypothetical protein
MQPVRQDPQGKCCRPNAFEIAYTQMRHTCAPKVDDEADTRCHTEERPPDTKNYA